MLKDLMYPIIGAIYEVHKELGPGLNEYVYQDGFSHAIRGGRHSL